MAPCPQSKPSASHQRAPIQRAPVLPAPVEEENIDLANVSNASEDEDEDTLPAPAKAQATPAGGANAPGNEVTHVAPIIKPVVKSNRALNVDLIFDCGKGKPSACKFCQ